MGFGVIFLTFERPNPGTVAQLNLRGRSPYTFPSQPHIAMKKYTALFAIVAIAVGALSVTVAADTKTKPVALDKIEPVALTNKNFEAKTSEGVVLIDFWAEWCGPCKAIAPTIKELAEEYHGKAVIAKVDVDANPELSKKFKIRSIPNLKIMKDGEVVDEIVGLVPKEEIEKKLKKHLN